MSRQFPNYLTSRLFYWISKHFLLLLLIGVTFSNQSLAEAPLKIGYNQWIGSAGLFIARDQQLFKKYGIEVEFTEFSGPGDGVAAVLAGQLDGVMTTTDNVILIADKAGLDKIVQVYFTDTSFGGDAIIAQSQYPSFKYLKGKTVAATLGQVNHLLLIKALHAVGLKETDIKLVNMDAEAAGAAFVAGRLDAAVTWEPWLTKGRAQGGHLVFSSADTPNLILDTLAVNTQLAASKPAAIKAFIAALDEGAAMVKQAPKKALGILAKTLGSQLSETEEMLAGVKLYSLADNKKLFDQGEFLKASQEVTQFMYQRNIISKAQDIAPLFDASYLP